MILTTSDTAPSFSCPRPSHAKCSCRPRIRRRSWMAVALMAAAAALPAQAFSPTNGVNRPMQAPHSHSHAPPTGTKKTKEQHGGSGTDLNSVTMMSPTRPIHSDGAGVNVNVKVDVGAVRRKVAAKLRSKKTSGTATANINAKKRKVTVPRTPIRKSTARASVGNAVSPTRRIRRPKIWNTAVLSNGADDGIENELEKRKSVNRLLTKDDERTYTLRLQALRQAIRVRDALIAQHDGVEPTELAWAKACNFTLVQLRRVVYIGQEAQSVIVSANVGLVKSIARRYSQALQNAAKADHSGIGTILTLSDMIQEGTLGLMMAAERFEPERNLRFSTYATYWIRQRILQSISMSSRTIRLPERVHSMMGKMHRARSQLRLEYNREPTDEEVASAMSITVDKLRKLAQATQQVMSLENRIGNGSSKMEADQRTFGDMVACPDHPTPVEAAQATSFKSDIREVVDSLAENERKVLILRYGLDDGTPLNIQDTADKLGVSRDKVRATEAQAMHKLRNPRWNYRLRDYVVHAASGRHTQKRPLPHIASGRRYVAETTVRTPEVPPAAKTPKEPQFPYNSEPYRMEQETKQQQDVEPDHKKIWFF